MKRITSTTNLLAVFVIVVFANSIIAAVGVGAGAPSVSLVIPAMAQSAQQDEFQLAVITVGSKLPADSRDYPLWIQLQTVKGSNPIQAPHDITLVLSTSDNSAVIVADERITISQHESMAMATIRTTDKPGASEITALAEGVTAGRSVINTVRPGSLEPSILSISAGSGRFIPDPDLPRKVYIQLLNSANAPAVTKEQLTVYLSSDNPNVGSLPAFVRIPAGSSGVLADFIPTFEQGRTKLTASANGFFPGEVEVRTVGPVGNKLVVEMAPSSIPAPVGFYSFFTVQIRDSTDMPVKANKPVTVTLTSSNTSVVDVPVQITIPAGSSYAVDRIKSKGTVGSAVVSASAQGFSSASINVNTQSENWGDVSAPKRINVSIIPSRITPDNKEDANIIVQVTDSLGRPFAFQHYLYNGIKLYSSDPAVGTVSEHLTRETTFQVGTAKSSRDGTAAITASRSGYSSGSANLESRGSLPVALSVEKLHDVVLANNVATTSVIVGLLDGRGNPTVAQKDIVLSLSSSDHDVARVKTSEYIPAGNSYALIEVYTTTRAGTTTITASAPGLATSSMQLKTVGSTGDASFYRLSLSTIPKLLADGRTYEAVFVQLQNAAGSPVPAKSDITVNLSSSSLNAGSVQSSVTIEAGTAFAIASITPTMTPSKFQITASSTGYATVSTELATSAQPLTIVRTSELPRTTPFQNMLVAVQVSSGGLPVENATVQIGGPGSETTQSVTDANGRAESMYVPTEPGRKEIVVTVTKPGYELTTARYTTTIEQKVAIYAEARTEAGKPIAVQAKISGASGSKTINVKAGAPAGLDDARWGSYRIEVPDVLNASGARYQFVSWSDGATQNPRTENIIRDSGFIAIYSAEYLLSASTELGTIAGMGYYPEGSRATISVSPTAVSGFITDKSFAGWSGDVQTASANAEILMDGPKTIKAEWDSNYLKLIGMLGAAGGGGVAAYLKVIKPKKDAMEKSKSPDLDWYKS